MENHRRDSVIADVRDLFRMGEKAGAFAKGGCGCLLAFAVFAAISLLLGGTAYIDIGGAILLFVIGGLLGLLILWIYNRGKHDRPGP